MDLFAVLSGVLVILITGLAYNGFSTTDSTSNTELSHATANVYLLSTNGIIVLNDTAINKPTVTPTNVVTNSSNITSNDINNSSASVSPVISNDTLTAVIDVSTTTSFPYITTDTFTSQVSLHLSYNKEFLCGGTIIDPKYIVTVAHCMYYSWGGILPPIILTVYTGWKNLSDVFYQQYEVENISFHESYNDSTLDFNIAVIEVKESISFNRIINKVSFGETLNCTNCVVTGWNKESKSLEAVDVNIINCNKVQATPGVLCASTLTSSNSLCNHSEGSSLICNGDLIGILSTAPSCGAANGTAIFQDLVKSEKWIKSNCMRASSAIRPCFKKLFTFLIILSVWLI